LDNTRAFEKEENNMKKWYLVDDITTNRSLMKSYVLDCSTQKEACEIGLARWSALSQHDRKERDAFFVGFAKASEYDETLPDFETITDTVDMTLFSSKLIDVNGTDVEVSRVFYTRGNDEHVHEAILLHDEFEELLEHDLLFDNKWKYEMLHNGYDVKEMLKSGDALYPVEKTLTDGFYHVAK